MLAYQFCININFILKLIFYIKINIIKLRNLNYKYFYLWKLYYYLVYQKHMLFLVPL